MQPSPKSKEQSAASLGHPALVDHIRETIRRDGPVTFAWFMEQALYHPAHGYYSSGRAEIGRRGDYFTNVSVGPLFGRLMAAQFAEMWEKLGRPNEFSIVEQGAHHGDFARDVLEAACAHHPDFFEAMRYTVVEPFPVLAQRQAAALTAFAAKTSWQKSIDDLPSFRGVHFSNELLDAMPVHLLQWNGEEWLERFVTECDGEFAFIAQPLSGDRLADYVRKIPRELPAGYQTEINLAAPAWLEAISRKLELGFIVAVDYGFLREEFYAPHRVSGSLQCYAKQQVITSPFCQIGQADISAHVEWTSLIEQGEASGLTTCGFTDQHHFLTGLISGALASEFESSQDAKMKRALQTLLHPEMLGRKFQFLVLAKNVASSVGLAGLRFAKA